MYSQVVSGGARRRTPRTRVAKTRKSRRTRTRKAVLVRSPRMPLTGFASSKRAKFSANWQVPSNTAISANSTDIIFFAGNGMINATGAYTSLNWAAPSSAPGAAGFASWSNVYAKYSVLASKVTVTLISLGAVPGSICKYALIPSRGLLGPGADMASINENKWTKSTYIGVNNSNRAFARLSKYMASHKVLGVTQTQYSDDDYTAQTQVAGPGSLPGLPASTNDIWNWALALRNCSGGAIPSASFAIDIKVTYYVKFTNCGVIVG